MNEQELQIFEDSFINQDNCPLSFDFLFEKPPSTGTKDRGNNILHFNSRNRPCSSGGRDVVDFVSNELMQAIVCESDSKVIQEAIKRSQEENKNSRNGVYLEFGFCTGRTLNFIAALGYNKNVFGFDSIDGLPKSWGDKPDRFPKGTFRYKKQYILNNEEMILSPRSENTGTNQLDDNGECKQKPFIPFIPLPNVQLVLGLIQNTLPTFIEYLEHKKFHIELIHIDTDIYESCQLIYETLNSLILPDKTIVILDEGYNWQGDVGSSDNRYAAWGNHEFRATNEFAYARGYRVEYFAYNNQHQQLALVFHNL